MKNIICILCSIIICQISYAQNDIKAFGYVNVSLVTISDNYRSSMKKAIVSNDDVKINPSALDYGIELGAFYGKIMGALDFDFYNVNGGETDEADFGGRTVNLKVGYDFSKSNDLLLIPSGRVGLMSTKMQIPFDADDPRTIGDFEITANDNDFRASTISYGVELSVVKLVPTRVIDAAVGISVWINYAGTDLNWRSSLVNSVGDVEAEKYNYYGVSLKIGAFWTK